MIAAGAAPAPQRSLRDSGLMLEAVHTAMVAAGVDVAAVYARLGFDARAASLRALRTPHGQQQFFWQAVEAVTGDPDIGLHLCPHMPVFRGEVIEYLMFSSPTFGEGYARAVKYLRLVSDALDIRIEHDRRGTRAVVVGSTLAAPELRHTEICVVHSLNQFVRVVTDAAQRPIAVNLTCEPRSPPREYERVFGCPVTFGAPRCTIEFDPALMEYRSPRWDPDLLRLHEALAEKRLTDLKRRDLVDRVRRVFSQRLELADCDLPQVARDLGMPARRLRIELARAGTSFSAQLADFRYALARRLLARTAEPVETVAYLTGFSEPSTFYRAFKRWAGVTPVQFRDSNRSDR